MKTNLTNWLCAICVVLLVAVVALQFKQQSRLDDLEHQQNALASAVSEQRKDQLDAATKLASQVATVGTNLESLLALDGHTQETTTEIRNMLQQQTAVIHRALGKVIPVELPQSLSDKIGTLETRISDTNSWPKNAAEAEEMMTELRDFVRQIPPWAEEDLLPRLNVLRWGTQSLLMLQTNAPAEGEALALAAEAYATQISVQPDGGSIAIATALESRRADATQRLAVCRRESAIKDAKGQLDLPVMTDGLAVWQRLNEWTNDPTWGQEIVKLRQQLRSKLLEDEVANFVATTAASEQRLTSLTNVALRQAGYFRALENVTVQRLILLDEKDVPDSAVTALAKLSASLEARIKAGAEEQSRGYQQWALQSISNFREAFDEALARSKPGRICGTNADPDYNGAVGAMSRYLFPISPGHLDSAVAKVYSQAFEYGWNKLGKADVKEDLQTRVAKEDATTAKKTPQNYQE